jgi:hypothetical protein
MVREAISIELNEVMNLVVTVAELPEGEALEEVAG